MIRLLEFSVNSLSKPRIPDGRGSRAPFGFGQYSSLLLFDSAKIGQLFQTSTGL
ncbi:MAG: hypothetical protein KAZ98_05295 [Prevotella sp.]|nr:hypothetical protein [Prevotella sp.]